METTEPNSEEGNPFYKRFSAYTDEEILEILRKHKDYQDLAVTEAVKIAIGRKLIHSEQDLMSPEFQYSNIRKFTIFPEVTNSYHRDRLIYSIFRYLYVLSLLPIIFGFLKYAIGDFTNTILGLVIGVIWFALSILLSRTRKSIFLLFLFVILLMVVFKIGLNIFAAPQIRLMDVFVLVIGTLLSAYLLVYLRKLIRH